LVGSGYSYLQEFMLARRGGERARRHHPVGAAGGFANPTCKQIPQHGGWTQTHLPDVQFGKA